VYLQGAEPFLLPGGRHGVLLIHGFTGLPAELRLLGEYLNARGFTVLAIRLAGHGTTVEDLSRMEHEDWMDSVRDGYAILSGACDRISVVGHSMGAVFAMLLSVEMEVAHVVSLCAPIMIAPEQGLEHLPTREACVDRYVPKARRKLSDVPNGANNTYRRMPLVSIHEVMDVIEVLCREIARVDAPILNRTHRVKAHSLKKMLGKMFPIFIIVCSENHIRVAGDQFLLTNIFSCQWNMSTETAHHIPNHPALVVV